MRRIVLLATVCALAVAKPEMYKEKEDFQYSRSSSDEGSKAGFYGAQRGNMGGNYEKAHNMDTLAQHQMSGLVRQIDGELGDGVKTRTGSVYSAANSRGVYGSGNYDLSNLEGRNFQEGTTYGESQSSSLSQRSGYNAHSSSDSRAYSDRHSQNSRHHSAYNTYQSGGYSGQDSQSRNSYTADNLQAARNYDYGSRDSLGYYSNTGYHGSNSNTQSSSSLHNSAGYGSDGQTRIISAMPVRVVIRPGGREAIPIATQTYDSTHRDSSYDRNAIGSEAETLTDQNMQTNIRPTDNTKHYESSYRYRKEWEKHDTVPVIMPTVSPYPKNSELYEDRQASTAGHSYDASRLSASNNLPSNAFTGYASSRQTQHQSNHNAQNERSSSGSNLNAYGLQAHTGGSAASLNLNNQVEDFSSKPKSYQSSYSYHKSWERQGDPYVIKPASNDNSQSSQRLTADSQYGSQYYGSQHHGSHTKSHQNYYGTNADCDENGHIRVARSYNTAQYNQFGQEAQNLEDLSQQTRSQWDQFEDGQQTQSQWDNLEDLGQQTQNAWNLENLEQQAQQQSDKLEDLGQQTQNHWDKQVAGKPIQGPWANFEQSQYNKLDPSQQLQDTWTILDHGPRELNNKVEQDSNPDPKFINANKFAHQSNDKLTNKEKIHSDSPNQVTIKETNEDPQAPDIPSIWSKEELKQQQTLQNNFYQNQGNSIFNSESNGLSLSSNTDSFTQGHLHEDNSGTNNGGFTPLANLWGKLDKIEEQSLNNLNKKNSNDSSNASLANKIIQNNEIKNINETKPSTSNVPDSNNLGYDSLRSKKNHPSDNGRGDIGPEEIDSSEDSPTIVSNVEKSITNRKPSFFETEVLNTIINKTAVNSENDNKNIHNTFDVRNSSQFDSAAGVSHFSHSKWFENENQYINADFKPKSTSTTTNSPSSNIDSSTQDISKQSFILEQPGKQERAPVVDDNVFNIHGMQETRNMDKLSPEHDTFHFPTIPESTKYDVNRENNTYFKHPSDHIDRIDINAQESGHNTDNFINKSGKNSLDQQNLEDLEQFAQQSDNFEQKSEAPKESFDQQSLVNLEQFSQQSNNFDQQNMSPQESFDQQSLFNLEQFSQQSNNFDQQNMSPQESFDQQSLVHLEQFSQPSNNFDQQNMSPQESFDQQSLGNLEQFSQKSNNFDEQNVSPQESFDQQSLGNLEPFSQQSNKFDEQNVRPQETFDQQSLGNLEPFSQQSNNFDEQNVSPQESFDQQSLGNLEPFSQQSNKFDEQNVSPQETFDQHSLGNLEHLFQQSNHFYQQNVSPQESFDQQSLGNLEQLSQQSNNFDQQNLGVLEGIPQQSNNFDQQNVSSQESFDEQNLDNLDHFAKQSNNFEQQNDDLVIPILVRENQSLSNVDQAGADQLHTDALVIPLQVRPQNRDQEQVQSTYSQQVVNNDFEQNPIQKQTMYNLQENQGRENSESIKSSNKDEASDIPPETVTEKPGFWKSVGNKFTSAKDKVASWFSSG